MTDARPGQDIPGQDEPGQDIPGQDEPEQGVPDHDAAELERLRALVGPSEIAYVALRADRDAAQQLAKVALAESGQLRGRLTEMSVELSRARQDQDVLQLRAEMAPIRQVIDRGRQRWATSVAPRVSRLADRFRAS